MPVFKLRLTTSVSTALPLVPTLPAVTLKLPAVMSTLSLALSPSSKAPATFKVTLWPVAVQLPTVKLLPAPVTVTCTAPPAASVWPTTEPAAPRLTVELALSASILKLLPAPVTAICTAPPAAAVCTDTLPAALKLKTPVLALPSVKALASLR